MFLMFSLYETTGGHLTGNVPGEIERKLTEKIGSEQVNVFC